MYSRPPVVALRDYLAAVVAAHPVIAINNDNQELRARVCAVVDELKAADWPPERVIVAVKQVADDAGLHSSRRLLSATDPLTERDAALVHMVRWSIEHYYRG
jgi:hypothetical protein